MSESIKYNSKNNQPFGFANAKGFSAGTYSNLKGHVFYAQITAMNKDS